ncbi:zinc transporter ZIP13 [Aplochiton taeniatus]
MRAGGCGRPSWAIAALLTGAALLVVTSKGASSTQKMSQSALVHTTATLAGPGPWMSDDLLCLWAFFTNEHADVWLFSLAGSILVGLSGIFPLLVIPIEAGLALKTEAGSQKLKQLLSFAIGGLLGDVFLHLLPEAWDHSRRSEGSHHHYVTQGLWVIMGLLSFLLLEKMFPDQESREEPASATVLCQHPANLWNSGLGLMIRLSFIFANVNNRINRMIEKARRLHKVTGFLHVVGLLWEQQADKASWLRVYLTLRCFWVFLSFQTSHTSSDETGCSLRNGHGSNTWSSSSTQKIHLEEVPDKIKTSGYLNLLANCIDNFTHGLAVAGSFQVSRKMGFLTTFAILLHEIPHEVGDFAILLRAGFDRWSAARMQLSTALGGVLGACFALCAQSPQGTENATSWILPFSSGGFLYIALVNVVPDLLEEASLRHSLLQILLLCCGIAVMGLLSAIVD